MSDDKSGEEFDVEIVEGDPDCEFPAIAIAEVLAILDEETLFRPSHDLNFRRWLEGVKRKITL